MMLMAGMRPAFAARQLGHSVEVFLRTYARWTAHKGESMSDDLIAQLRICANRGPGPFDPHWADSAKRLMRWAANALDAAEPAMRAEYERGRSERESRRREHEHGC